MLLFYCVVMSTVLWVNAIILVLSLSQPLNLTFLADLHSLWLATKETKKSTNQKKKSNMAFHWDTGFVALFKIISQSPQCAKLKGGSTKCRNHSCCLLCSIVTYNIKKREWWLKKQQQQKTQASVIDRTLPTSFKLNYTAC